MLDAARPIENWPFVHHDDADLLDEPARLAEARIPTASHTQDQQWIGVDTYV